MTKPKEEVVDYIEEVFEEDTQTALRVAHCESRFGKDRVNTNSNGTRDFGPFQINEIHAHRGNLTNWKENIEIAYEIYQEQGFNPWVCFWKYGEGW